MKKIILVLGILINSLIQTISIWAEPEINYEFETITYSPYYKAAVIGVSESGADISITIPSVIYKDDIPYTVTRIKNLQNYTFKKVTIPNTVIDLTHQAFKNSVIEELIFEDGYEQIDVEMNVGTWDVKTPRTFENSEIKKIYIGRKMRDWGSQNPGYPHTGPDTFLPQTIEEIIIGNCVSDINLLLLYKQKTTATLSHYENLKTVQFGALISTLPKLSDNEELTSLKLTGATCPATPSFSENQYDNLIVNVPTGLIAEYKNTMPWNKFTNINGVDFLYACIENDNILYQIIDNGKIEVLRNSSTYSGNIKIPATFTYNNTLYTVTSIGNAFQNSYITSLELPSTIEALNSSCLSNTSLVSLDLSQTNILTIPTNALMGCKSLEEILLPQSLNSILNNAFQNCIKIKEINCPESLISIGNSAFEGCSNLEKVKLGVNTNFVGASCFKDCNKLYEVTNYGKVQIINDQTFYSCSKLTNIDFNNQIQSIGSSALYYCSSLDKFIISPYLNQFGESSFNSAGLTEFIIEDSDQPIIFPYGNYDGNTGIQKKTVWGQTVQFKITYYYPYFRNTGIEKLYLNRSLDGSPRYTIKGDGGVDYFDIVSYDAPFSKLYKLKYLEIGENVDCLGSEPYYIYDLDLNITAGSFKNCDLLEIINVLNPTPPTGAEFSDKTYNNGTLYVPVGSKNLYSKADGWKEFMNIREGVYIPLESISFEAEEFSIFTGETKELTLLITPENATYSNITWESSNENIVSVSEDGLISAISPGSATITATIENLSASCTVKVSDPIIDAEQIIFSYENIELNLEESFQLEATVLPENTTDKTLTWTSSKSKVASVSDSGLIEGLSLGTTTITATCGEVSASCEVTVKRAPVEKIELTTYEIDLGEEEWGLTATIYPETAGGTKISWSTSNDLVKIRVWDWTDDLETCSKISINRAGTESGVCEVTATAGDMSATCVVNVLPDAGVESLLANPDSKISIYSTDGILIKKDCKVEDLKTLNKGIYIIVFGKEHYKISI